MMTAENKTRFEMAGDLPVLFLASSTPVQVYKDAVVLRRTRQAAGDPLPERIWAGFDANSRLFDLDGAETIRALMLAHFHVLGFVGDRPEVATLARSARLPHAQRVLNSPAPDPVVEAVSSEVEEPVAPVARAAVSQAMPDEDVAELEGWATPARTCLDKPAPLATAPTHCAPCHQAIGVAMPSIASETASVDSLPPASQWTLEALDLPTPESHADRVALSLSAALPQAIPPESPVWDQVDAVKGDAAEPAQCAEQAPSRQEVAPSGSSIAMVYPPTCTRDRVHGGQIVEGPGDVVATRLVANGAELVAGGSIHVYGPLLGRALAGAYGDTNARIYASDFRAELVSIAGRFQVFEEIPEQILGQAVEIWLEGEVLMFAPLGEVGCPPA